MNPVSLFAPPMPGGDRISPLALLLARDRAILKWGARWLERSGFEVLVTESVGQALAYAARRPSSVLLFEERAFSDHRSDLLTGLGAHESLAPLVVLTASEEGVEWALQAGVADIIRLPCDWRVVGRRALTVAGMSRAAVELRRMSGLLDEARSAAQESRRLLTQATGFDPLTELPNRRRFEELLGQALKGQSPADGRIAVLFLDLDRFRALNEGAGQEVGDQVLRKLAGRLMSAARDGVLVGRTVPGVSTAAVARFSGDAFGMMLSSIGEHRDLETMARRILERVAQPVRVDGKGYHLSASMGISVAPEDGLEPQVLVQRAETALGLARSRGGGAFRFYQPELARSTRAHELEQALHDAVDRGELSLVFQPLVEVKSRQIVGVEALLRWSHAELGEVEPDEFIPLAEESGLIVPIGNWVIRSACAQLRRWLDAGVRPLRLAVNLSAGQLLHEDLPQVVADALREHRIDPPWLELEISERGSFRDDREVERAFARLKELGIRLSVDDFGTGQSAIVYLRRYSVDVLKIDRSYITAIHRSENDAVMASAIVAMARKLGLSVVAEGVEVEAQRQALEHWGCDTFQGLLFAPGVCAAEVEALLVRQENGP